MATSSINELTDISALDLVPLDEKTLTMWYMRATKLIESISQQKPLERVFYEGLRDWLISDARILRGEKALEDEINKDVSGMTLQQLQKWSIDISRRGKVDQKIRVTNKFNKEQAKFGK